MSQSAFHVRVLRGNFIEKKIGLSEKEKSLCMLHHSSQYPYIPSEKSWTEFAGIMGVFFEQ